MLDTAFQLAALGRPDQLVDTTRVVGGLPVRLRIAGRGLAAALAAGLPPEPTGSTRPGENGAPGGQGLVVEVWDAHESGIPVPAVGDMAAGPRRWPMRLCTLVASNDGRHIGCLTAGSVTWLDRAAGRVVGCWTSADALSSQEHGRPFHFLLSVWLLDQGIQVVHAALVAWDGHGILLPGVSGAGKSTAALAAALDGFDFLGDDLVGLAPAPLGWTGQSLYGSAWLEPGHLARFPGGLRAVAVPVDGVRGAIEKCLVRLPQTPAACRTSALVRVIAVPRVTLTGDTTVRPLARREAYRALTLGTLAHVVPRPGPRELAWLGDLVARTPCYRLDLGRDLSAIGPALRGLVRGGGAT